MNLIKAPEGYRCCDCPDNAHSLIFYPTLPDLNLCRSCLYQLRWAIEDALNDRKDNATDDSPAQ